MNNYLCGKGFRLDKNMKEQIIALNEVQTLFGILKIELEDN